MKTKTVPWDFCDPGCMELFSPEFIQGLGLGPLQSLLFPTLPTKINSTADLLNLPVYNGTSSIYQGFGIGNGTFPGLYEHNQGGRNQRIGAYGMDTWKVRDNLTVNFGLGWEVETGLFYSNIPLPQFLSPILEGQTGGVPYGLGATQPNKKDFSPSHWVRMVAREIEEDRHSRRRRHVLGYATHLGALPGRRFHRAGGRWENDAGRQRFTNTIPGIINLSSGGMPVPLARRYRLTR